VRPFAYPPCAWRERARPRGGPARDAAARGPTRRSSTPAPLHRTDRLDAAACPAQLDDARRAFAAGDLGLPDIVCFAERDLRGARV